MGKGFRDLRYVHSILVGHDHGELVGNWEGGGHG